MPLIFSRLARTLALPLTLSAAGALSSSAQSSAPSAVADTASEELINADRPGIADGSRVIEPGQLQLEIGAQAERHIDPSSRTTLSFAPTLMRLGILHQLELRIESNTLTHLHTTTTDSGITSADDATGFSPVLIGFKLALYDSRDDDRVSVGTILRVAPPSGSNGFNTSHPIGDLRLAADWDFAPRLSLNPNVGIARYEGSDGDLFTTTLGALTLTYQPTPTLSPFVDLGYQSREVTDGTWSLIIDAGVGYIIGRTVQLDASAGTRAHGDTPPQPFAAVGISVRASPFHHRSH